MESEWHEFGNLYQEPSRNGLTRPRRVRGDGVKMVNMGELFAHSRIRDIEMDRVPLSEDEARHYLLQNKDLLFARQSLVLEGAGKCSIYLGAIEPVTFEGHLIRVRLNKDLADSLFYYYFFNSGLGRAAIKSIVEQVAAAGIRGSDLAKLRVPYPPLPEQRAIAHILGTLDDKIELNRRMNATLEGMARALFKAWFVDGAEAGWEVKTIGEVCEFAYGKSLRADNRQPGPIPVYGSNGQVGWHSEALAKGPGIIVGRKGNPGTVVWSQTDFFPIDTTFHVLPKGSIKSMYYLFHALSGQNLASLGADSAVPGLNRNMAYMTRLRVPPEVLINSFDKQVAVLSEKIFSNERQSRTLAALRDALLPKLISGEVRVKDAETFVGDIA